MSLQSDLATNRVLQLLIIFLQQFDMNLCVLVNILLKSLNQIRNLTANVLRGHVELLLFRNQFLNIFLLQNYFIQGLLIYAYVLVLFLKKIDSLQKKLNLLLHYKRIVLGEEVDLWICLYLFC